MRLKLYSGSTHSSERWRQQRSSMVCIEKIALEPMLALTLEYFRWMSVFAIHIKGIGASICVADHTFARLLFVLQGVQVKTIIDLFTKRHLRRNESIHHLLRRTYYYGSRTLSNFCIRHVDVGFDGNGMILGQFSSNV